jgi:hypothetical protein
MNRQDIETLQQRVREAMRTLEELKKTPQAVAGDSWVFYRHDAAPEWDFEVHNVTDPSYKKTYKVTYEVPDPSRGFINWFYFYEFDTEMQDISFHTDPVADDPYSFWLTVSHVDYNSDPAGIKMRFKIFSTQKGNLVFNEQ